VSASGPVLGVGGLDHVGLNVPDLDQAVTFFTEAFGATTVFRLGRTSDPEGGSMERLGAPREAAFELAMLELGSGRLELLRWWSVDQADREPRSSDVGACHVSVLVSDVTAAVEGLRTREGVRVLGEPVTFDAGATPGLTNAFVTTPWGALIELVNWGR
jgi:catechol 2,3-dioxygenase-like lactoylglutathione lyase family enzyme